MFSKGGGKIWKKNTQSILFFATCTPISEEFKSYLTACWEIIKIIINRSFFSKVVRINNAVPLYPKKKKYLHVWFVKSSEFRKLKVPLFHIVYGMQQSDLYLGWKQMESQRKNISEKFNDLEKKIVNRTTFHNNTFMCVGLISPNSPNSMTILKILGKAGLEFSSKSS